MIRLNNYRRAQSLVCLIGYETIILHGYFTTSAQYDIVHNLKTLIIYPLPRLMPVASNGLFCKLYFYYLILILVICLHDVLYLLRELRMIAGASLVIKKHLNFYI